MPRNVLIVVLVLCASALTAQVPLATSPTTKSLSTKESSARDPEMLAKKLLGSYYHPDNLSSMNCDVSVDWSPVLQALKANVLPERLAAIQALKIRSNAVRGQTPELTFNWGDQTSDRKEQMEEALKKMVGGYYQFYWSMIATPLVKSPKDFGKIEPLADGGSKIYGSDKNMSVTVLTDKDGVPLHYSFDGLSIKGTIDAHYVPSPRPEPGDLRRVSNIAVSEQIGSSNINVSLDLDYQSVSGFNIPRRVNFDILGAYSIPMVFSECSVTSENASAQ